LRADAHRCLCHEMVNSWPMNWPFWMSTTAAS